MSEKQTPHSVRFMNALISGGFAIVTDDEVKIAWDEE